MEKVNRIEHGTYEGYIWLSDRQEPDILEQQNFDCSLDIEANPFIIEAQLYDKFAKVSYSVKYIDGNYIAYKFEDIESCVHNTDKHCEINECDFCSNRMGDRILVFQQWWREQPDPLCEGMQVLQPAEMIFVGFKKEGGK